MPDQPPHQKLLGRLSLETELGAFLGTTRIRLLEAIERHGSISRAAKALPLSYKAAWDAVEDMNNLAEEPLVHRSAGGTRGGGTTLTDYGRRMVAFYRALEQNYQEMLETSARTLGAGGAADFQQFRRLLRSLGMKTSARNRFVGPVTALAASGLNVEVRVRVDASNDLVASITRESALHLGLKIGDEVHALAKAPLVTICTDAAVPAGTANRFRGTIDRIEAGESHCEVSLLLPSGRSVVAVVAPAAVRDAGLGVGAAATAFVAPSSVILVSFD
jgi:molybdate transport system regulatory protein